jgi:mycothiol synthase
MTLTVRRYDSDTDPVSIAALIRTLPSTSRHVVDFSWRLSSPLLDSEANGRVWLDDDVLVGFAAWQVWWAALDIYVRPGPSQQEVEAAVFDWAGRRFHELDLARGKPLPYWVESHEDDLKRLELLTRQGYTLEDDYTYLMLRRSLSGLLPRPEPPAGFTIRPIAGLRELAACVELHRRAFASTAMTLEWRERTLRMPGYEPGLDLVAVSPSGQLVGFCVGWTAPERGEAQIEPLGIDPAFARQGLGRALLLEMLSRFKASGAAQAQVETESGRTPALRAYESVGFRQAHRSVRRGQWFSRHVNTLD